MNIPFIPSLSLTPFTENINRVQELPNDPAAFPRMRVAVIEHINAVLESGVDALKRPNTQPAWHDFRTEYTEPLNVFNDYSDDLTRHMLSQAANPNALLHREVLSPAPILSVVSDLQTGNTILDEEVRPIDDMQIERIAADNSALSNTAFADTVSVTSVVPENVVSLDARRTYPSGLDVAAIGDIAKNLASLGDDARAHLTEAA